MIEHCPLKSSALSQLGIELDCVVQAQILASSIDGLLHKTLLIDFVQPMLIFSSLAGFKEQVASIGNHYLPADSWGSYDANGLLELHARTCQHLDRPAQSSCLLFTGVDVDRLSLQRQRYQETLVYALVTAGVKSNAAHMVRDRGNYHEPGTINVLLLSNRSLTPRAMAQALIVATEAKTAALRDLDIRSCYTPLHNAATGTGTDGLLVVQGNGSSVEYAGGHTKLGELIARAVYAGVVEALGHWEGLASGRGILARLQERTLVLRDLFVLSDCFDSGLGAALEELLREPHYAGFMATVLAINDAYESGLIDELSYFDRSCRQLAEEIAGDRVVECFDLIKSDGLPLVLKIAFNSLANGLIIQRRKTAC